MTHKAAAKFTVAHQALAQRLSERERGASALEYVGMIVVAALLVVAIWGAMDAADVGGAVEEQVDKILDPESAGGGLF